MSEVQCKIVHTLSHGRTRINLEPLLKPRSVAVLGASERPSPGQMIMESLGRIGFPGAIYPVNPKYERLFGRPCYASIAELPVGVDVLALCVNHTRVLEHLPAAAERGVRAAVIFDGGFAESGREGGRRQDELVARCRAAGIALCGPNCMGYVSPHARALVYIQQLRDPASLAGNIGLVSQSGSVCIGLLADCRRFGWSHAISSGNEAVLTTADFLDYLIDDPATRVIALFLETIRQPEQFVAALDRAADRGKPVVVLKVGRSERARRAITSHTGGLAGEGRVFSAVLRAHRAIEVTDLDEMAEVLACSQAERWPQGRRLAVMTASGGQAELILDLAASAALELPPLSDDTRAEVASVLGWVAGDGNPLDAWGHGDFARNFPHALSVLGRDPDSDVVVLSSDSFDDQPFGTPERLLAYARILTEVAMKSPKPFYYMTSRSGIFRRDLLALLRVHGIPLLGGTRQGLGAVDRLARWAEPLPPLTNPPRAMHGIQGALASGQRRTIHEHDAKRLLAAAGLPVVRERLVTAVPDARTAATDLGYPVALKVVSDEIPHRSDLGLVAVGLRDEHDLAREWERMSRRLEEISPRAEAHFLVQEQVNGGVEVFAGVQVDPAFGPVLAFGAGGVLVEALADVALRPLPLRVGEAQVMVEETRVGALLTGFRGRPPGDIAALCRCLTALADFAWSERAWLTELDVNPIVVRERGCVVVDALIVPR
ncbi:MAG: acetate--CoA ligase family protein [Candidatus Rokuibacteriota bacterium]